MDAPLITLDPSANTTDVYAFMDHSNQKTNLVVALGVYPFEEPGNWPEQVTTSMTTCCTRFMSPSG